MQTGVVGALDLAGLAYANTCTLWQHTFTASVSSAAETSRDGPPAIRSVCQWRFRNGDNFILPPRASEFDGAL
jgi:hypothetical protein